MCSLNTYKIDLNGLKEGTTTLEFHLGNAYFEEIKEVGEPEVARGNLLVKLDIQRRGQYFDFDFNIKGTIYVSCDLCLADMEQAIETDDKLVVKFGKEYLEEDNLVTIDENEGTLNVAWFIYEFIALNIPIKHVHAPGKCDSAMIEVLNKHSATRSGEGEDNKAIDSRWRELEKLRTIIKD